MVRIRQDSPRSGGIEGRDVRRLKGRIARDSLHGIASRDPNSSATTPNVAVDRLYLTGFSRGGQVPWNFHGDGDKGVTESRISFRALKDNGATDVSQPRPAVISSTFTF